MKMTFASDDAESADKDKVVQPRINAECADKDKVLCTDMLAQRNLLRKRIRLGSWV